MKSITPGGPAARYNSPIDPEHLEESVNQQQQPVGPFTVAGYQHQQHASIAEARIYAGRKQGHDHRSMQILDRDGAVVDLKRF